MSGSSFTKSDGFGGPLQDVLQGRRATHLFAKSSAAYYAPSDRAATLRKLEKLRVVPARSQDAERAAALNTWRENLSAIAAAAVQALGTSALPETLRGTSADDHLWRPADAGRRTLQCLDALRTVVQNEPQGLFHGTFLLWHSLAAELRHERQCSEPPLLEQPPAL